MDQYAHFGNGIGKEERADEGDEGIGHSENHIADHEEVQAVGLG